jgi:hypothetical protein
MTIFFLLLLGTIGKVQASSFTAESAEDRMNRIQFVQEMERIEQEILQRKSQKSLQERLLQVAKQVLPDTQIPFFTTSSSKRHLANNYNNNNYNNYQQQQQKNDDYLSNYIYAYDNSVDLSGFAMKYVGCQNVHQWDDNLADGRTSPLAMNRFVMFRMCKANDCSSYNKWGCNYNYGEYVIPMEDYSAIMAEYHFEQYGRFCKTCYRCMHLDYYQTDDATSYNSTSTSTDDGYYDDDGTNANSYYSGYDDAYNINGVNGYSGGCNLNDDGCTDDQYWAGT